MSTGKALLWAFGITAVSATLLTALHGTPTMAQLIGGGATMFAVAFLVFKQTPDEPEEE